MNKFISLGITSLDIFLSGGSGLTMGKIYEVFGEESSAKSTLSQYCMIKFKEQYKSGTALYIDTENSFDLLRYAYMGGKPDIVVFKTIIVEDLLSKTIGILKEAHESKQPAFIVWDTIAATILKDSDETHLFSAGIAAKPRILNSILPYISELLATTDSTLIILNQVYSTINKFGGVKTKGGRGIRYFSSVRIQIRRVKDYKIEAGGISIAEAIGVELKSVKNKLFYPRLETFLYIHNEKGIQPYETLIEYLKESKIVSSAGAWKRLKIGDKIDFKFNNVNSFKSALDKDKNIINEINYIIYNKFSSISPLAKIKLLKCLNREEKKLSKPLTTLTNSEKEIVKIESKLLEITKDG